MNDESREGKLALKLVAEDVAMFRFALESYENVAMFTVLERDPALIKLYFYEGSRKTVLKILNEIKRTIPLEILPWPKARGK